MVAVHHHLTYDIKLGIFSLVRQDSRVATTLRLSPTTADALQRASVLIRKSKNQIVEEALTDYLKNKGVFTKYQMIMTKDQVILLNLENGSPELVSVQERNGEAPEKTRERFALNLNAPVALVISDKEKSHG